MPLGRARKTAFQAAAARSGASPCCICPRGGWPTFGVTPPSQGAPLVRPRRPCRREPVHVQPAAVRIAVDRPAGPSSARGAGRCRSPACCSFSPWSSRSSGVANRPNPPAAGLEEGRMVGRPQHAAIVRAPPTAPWISTPRLPLPLQQHQGRCWTSCSQISRAFQQHGMEPRPRPAADGVWRRAAAASCAGRRTARAPSLRPPMVCRSTTRRPCSLCPTAAYGQRELTRAAHIRRTATAWARFGLTPSLRVFLFSRFPAFMLDNDGSIWTSSYPRSRSIASTGKFGGHRNCRDDAPLQGPVAPHNVDAARQRSHALAGPRTRRHSAF